MNLLKIKFLSGRIFTTALVLFLPFIPVSLANIGQPEHDLTTIEVLENVYFHIILFPVGYIVYFMNLHNIAIILISIIADSYIIAFILNNLFDILREKIRQ